ncbi:subtilisin-like protein [Conidiobolus coronatus NRRL 28638]|uniref:Subtilisin-like protein n=1 Tax=Conidiobolus coronatus (strain ATCC 28846 / CBS 209.66 / NRRL 28638) TaxID=796925 RepID=A0A137NZ14_CONC2|nr:subtilisin-like protein [Conidiobolus coronatus NRRL 28638]|eukprot:KXN67948.1 subtilisin-like protein [Conidiobolus coronatus NRRL 28638]
MVLNQFLKVLNSLSEGSELIHVYYTLIQGAAFRSEVGAIDVLRAIPSVDNIEPDQVVQANYETQEDAPWGLARVSQRDKLSGSIYSYNYKVNAGDDVNVYVVDTGINIEHNDFEGRAVWGKTIPANSPEEDDHGHGTHCAGIIGGKNYGVAKKANLIAVKVLNDQGSGSNSDVIAGIEWVVEDPRSGKGKVISMSLGGIISPTLDTVVDRAVDKGVVVVVAAGNDSSDACLYSPARASKAVTVGATNIKDEKAFFSNSGPCVDIFAPGQDIRSAWIGNDDATKTISGTSMACPHIAGLAAAFIGQGTETKDVPKKLNDVSTKDKISMIPVLTANRLGYNDYLSNSRYI